MAETKKINMLEMVSRIPEFKRGFTNQYQLNLLDTVISVEKLRENSHSRVLRLLFEYRDVVTKEFSILQSFLRFLGPPFSELGVKNPKIVNEEGRIDISVVDEDFALIIENKINWAKDQPKQIQGYIENIKGPGGRDFDIRKIYVVYLTRDGGQPSLDRLPPETKDRLADRYLARNYKHHILPWLRNIRIDKTPYNVLIECSLVQYINHLEGLLGVVQEDRIYLDEMLGHLEGASVGQNVVDPSVNLGQGANSAQGIFVGRNLLGPPFLTRDSLVPVGAHGTAEDEEPFSVQSVDVPVLEDEDAVGYLPNGGTIALRPR